MKGEFESLRTPGTGADGMIGLAPSTAYVIASGEAISELHLRLRLRPNQVGDTPPSARLAMTVCLSDFVPALMG